jgi:hypothetical protein
VDVEKLVIFFIIFVISQLVNLFSKSGKQDVAPAPRQVGPAKSGKPPASQQARRAQTQQAPTGRPPSAPRGADQKTTLPPRRQLESSLPNTNSRPSGAAVREHVNSYMEPRINAQVQQHIDQHVQAHIGSNQAAAVTTSHDDPAYQTGASIRQLLKNPGGVRQAILVNEILKRPRAFR